MTRFACKAYRGSSGEIKQLSVNAVVEDMARIDSRDHASFATLGFEKIVVEDIGLVLGLFVLAVACHWVQCRTCPFRRRPRVLRTYENTVPVGQEKKAVESSTLNGFSTLPPVEDVLQTPPSSDLLLLPPPPTLHSARPDPHTTLPHFSRRLPADDTGTGTLKSRLGNHENQSATTCQRHPKGILHPRWR